MAMSSSVRRYRAQKHSRVPIVVGEPLWNDDGSASGQISRIELEKRINTGLTKVMPCRRADGGSTW